MKDCSVEATGDARVPGRTRQSQQNRNSGVAVAVALIKRSSKGRNTPCGSAHKVGSLLFMAVVSFMNNQLKFLKELQSHLVLMVKAKLSLGRLGR